MSEEIINKYPSKKQIISVVGQFIISMLVICPSLFSIRSNASAVSGDIDTSFTTNLGTTFQNTSLTKATEAGGYIYALVFESSGTTKLLKLDKNGNLKKTFILSGGAQDLLSEPNGSVSLCGSFTHINGVATNHIANIATDDTTISEIPNSLPNCRSFGHVNNKYLVSDANYNLQIIDTSTLS
jgi:hypothetical protein